MVIWITGLSGAGKTTIGSMVYQEIRKEYPNVVFLDGDNLRDILESRGYTYKQRFEQAKKISSLCKMLESQGIHVVCATMSLFHEIHKLNRERFEEYYEIYLKTDIDILIARDTKGIYKKALAKEIESVVGIDIPYEEPKDPHLVIDNQFENTNDNINKIIKTICMNGRKIND